MNEQDPVIAFLSRPESYGRPGEPVERIETHGSLIFLQADRAYKLKRAIAFAALDFLSLESREWACRRELWLNRRTAPELYLEVRSINRSADERLAFNGSGAVLDWVVVMRRFPQDALFERMAMTGRLTPTQIERLGGEIARFHAAAEITPCFGGAVGARRDLARNHRELMRYPALLDRQEVQALHRDARATIDQLGELLERRRREGRVRRGHGDLRLANICLFQGRPRLFDCIEFSDPLACIDVLYDLAFPLMDLQHHGLDELAALLLSSYLRHSDETADCSPLPLFLSLRAATRCFTLACSAQRHNEPGVIHQKREEAQALLKQARAYLLMNEPCRLA
ncbi:MAG TPA: phosphotransferase [Pseudomonas sp.]|nr:phosphotransferase [Pseudomonas sp.]